MLSHWQTLGEAVVIWTDSLAVNYWAPIWTRLFCINRVHCDRGGQVMSNTHHSLHSDWADKRSGAASVWFHTLCSRWNNGRTALSRPFQATPIVRVQLYQAGASAQFFTLHQLNFRLVPFNGASRMLFKQMSHIFVIPDIEFFCLYWEIHPILAPNFIRSPKPC